MEEGWKLCAQILSRATLCMLVENKREEQDPLFYICHKPLSLSTYRKPDTRSTDPALERRENILP